MRDNDIAALAATFDHFPTRGVCVVDGYGIKIRVDRRHLVISDGIGRHRREARFHKATCQLDRLVIVGHTGYLTLEALRWLEDAGIGLMHLDVNGRVLTTSASFGVRNAPLRRAQALAVGNGIGMAITRDLLTEKIQGQARVATQLSPSAAAAVARHLPRLDEATTLDELLITEAAAAADYWQAWSDLPVHFVKTDAQTVPDHWRTFGTRGSPLSGVNRLAANPANALLNYLYALLEAEARIGAGTAGLDPGIGILHADQPHRDNLALDVMEAARPDVDAYLLDLLRSHTFRASDFHETRKGVCRIRPPLTHAIAATTTTWAKRLGPVIEDVIKHLKRTPGINMSRIPTPLTESNRSRGRDGIRRDSKQARRKTPKPTARCADCGTNIRADRRRCSPCNEAFQTERFGKLGNETLTALRKAGDDPAKRPETKAKISATNKAHQDAISNWKPGNGPTDPEYFRTQILPLLQHASLRKMARATRLSQGYCSLIRRGERVPHPRHWLALQQIQAPGGRSGASNGAQSDGGSTALDNLA